MPINVGGIEVEIKLNNGQLVSGLIKNEELVKLTGQKIEGHMSRTSAKVSNAFSRMFGIGALIGVGISAVRALYKAIGDGIGRAIDKNQALKNSLQNIQDNFAALFTRIGLWITPLIEKLAPFANLIGQMAGQNILVQNANTTTKLDDLKKWVQYWIDSGKLSNKEIQQYNEILTQISAKYQIIAAREKAEADAIRDKNKEFKKQIEEQYSIHFKNAKDNSDKLKESTKAVLDGVNKLIPAGSEAGEKINKIGQAIVQIAEKAQNFSIEALGAGGIVTIFATLISLGNQLAQSINNAISESTINSQKLAIAGVTAEVEKYQNALNKLNIDLQWFKQQVETEKTSYNTDTAEGIEKTVNANEKIIEQNKTAIEQYKQIVSTAKSKYGEDLTGAQQSVADKITQLELTKAQIDAMPDTDIFGNKNTTKEKLLSNYYILKAQLEADAKYLQTAIDAQTSLNGLEGENATLTQENIDLNERKTDLMNEQAEAAQAVADAMKDQTRELLSQQAKLGLLDIENYGDALLALSQLQTAGYSGLDLLSAMSDLGFSNELSQSTRVGQIVVNNYMASNNSANIQAMLSNQFGA